MVFTYTHTHSTLQIMLYVMQHLSSTLLTEKLHNCTCLKHTHIQCMHVPPSHTHTHTPTAVNLWPSLLLFGCVLSLVVSGCARSAGAWPAQRSSTTVTTKRPRRTRASRAWALRTSGSVLDPAVRSLQLGMVPSHSSRFAGNSKASAGVAIDCNKVSVHFLCGITTLLLSL